MITRPSSRRKRVLLAIIAMILLAVAALLLMGCPATTRVSKRDAGSAEKLLDSAALIRRLAHLTTAEMEGRETGTPGGRAAQLYISHQLDSLHLDTAFVQPFPLRNDTNRVGYNMVNIIRGTQYPDSYIAITAHYDHLGNRNGSIYYGADDNASGTANLLTLAQYFKQHRPRHSLILVAFDAEEKGLLGSKYFVDHLPVPQSSIILNVNMDMISRNDNKEIFACGIYHYPFLKKYVDSVQSLTPITIRFGHDDPKTGSQDWTSQSDHYAFHLKKIPFLYFGVEDHADYHKPSDTFDKIDKSFYYQVCTMIANTILVLDRQRKLQ